MGHYTLTGIVLPRSQASIFLGIVLNTGSEPQWPYLLCDPLHPLDFNSGVENWPLSG